jgi:protein-disulfide isomerase
MPGCAAPAAGPKGGADAVYLELPGIDTSELTSRERSEWGVLVSELLAPCPDVAVSIGECVSARRPCSSCPIAATFLARQIRAGKPRGLVVDLFDARFDPGRVKTIAVGDSPATGPADAAVTIVKWADFQCPACAAMSLLLDETLARFSKEVRLVYKHFPISYHTYAELAARASIAADRQGKFWPMHHTLYANREALGAPDLDRYAAELGLDLERFHRDLENPAVKGVVDRDRRQGESLGVRSTPTLFVNGREVPVVVMQDPAVELEDWIRTELELGGNAGSRTEGASR